jgi:hypothetical protein
MAHFAELDENSIVIRVLVTDNDAQNEGLDWLIKSFGGTWMQTSYNATIRKNFAGIGFSYNSELDAFIPPKPHESWVDNGHFGWEAPAPYPQDGNGYYWDEPSASWTEAP